MQRLMSVLLVAVVACGDAGDDGSANFPDASAAADAGAASDGAPFPQGLELTWDDMPPLPGVLSPTVTVMTVKFHVKKLEVLGDAGSIAETTADELDLVWNPTVTPLPILFRDAPPAIYSKVRLNIDKGDSNAPSVEILGTTTANGSAEMFKITSTRKLDLEITGYNIQLGISESERVSVLVGLDDGLANVDWSTLPVMTNARTLEDGNTQAMDGFFDDLEDVFTAP